MFSLATVFLLIALLAVLLRPSKRQRSLPPGPKGLPFIGPMLELSTRKEPLWLLHANWSKIYGDIYHYSILGHNTIVLNSAEAMIQLLDKRSRNYSDRPDMPMLMNLIKFDWVFTLMRYSDWWRLHRRTFHQFFQPRMVPQYHAIQRAATGELMKNLMSSPEDFVDHIRFASDSAILQVSYGYTMKQKDDPYIAVVNKAGKAIVAAGNHGTYWVDYFPILQLVPSWLPGAGFKRSARIWTAYSADLVNLPWDWLKRPIEDGTAPPSFCTKSLERLSVTIGEGSPMEDVIKNCASLAYLGAAETTPSAILNFILAMVLNPTVQARAQAEIDDVIGPSRLPDYEDRDKLPFIKAVIAETLRWQPILPHVVPHRAVNDDVYNGYLISAGSTIMPNVWAVLHDEDVYGPNHMDFNPDRFVERDGKKLPPDPELFIFGFGRRICPGRYFAVNTLFLVVTHLLATFTIAKQLDDQGKEILPEVEFIDELTSPPKPFKCRFIPRTSSSLPN